MTQAKITRTTLKPGDELVVTGEAPRDESSLRLLISTVKRPSDGFEWRGVRIDMFRFVLVGVLVVAVVQGDALAQGRGRGGGAPQGPAPPRAWMAPKDYTGYWVSVVTEHWHLHADAPEG